LDGGAPVPNDWLEAGMCCIFLVLTFLGPRFGILIWWAAEPGRFDKVFDTFIWPALGWLVVPWTTLMYVGVGINGVDGFDWFWLGFALLADVAMYSGSAYKREQVPGYSTYVSNSGA
jgi:hypothetical protein